MQLKRILLLLKRCSSNIKPFMKQNIAFIALTEGVVGLTLLIPLLVRFLIDNVLGENRWELFPTFVICMVAVIFLSRILSIATNILYNLFSANIEAKARDALFWYVLKKDLAFFNNTGDGEIIDRLMSSPEQLHTIPSLYFERLLSSIATIVVVFIILFSINSVMALFSLFAVPLFIFVYVKTRTRFFSQVQKAREECSSLTNFFVGIFRNIVQVKNLGSESYEHKEGECRNNKIRNLCLQFSITGAFVTNGVQIVTQLNQLGVLIYGALLIHKANMTIGALVAFYSYLEMLYAPIISIIHTLNDMNQSLVGIERYLEFYNNKNEEDYTSGDRKTISSPSICFSHVSFAHGEHCVLKDVNMYISAGEKVLLVGKSGIGKSTIVSLIKRFYQCSDGEITIGGVDIRKYDLRALRKNVNFVMQNNSFLPVSIRENFHRFNPQLTDSEIIEILKKVQMYDDIFSLGKDGLDTLLDKNAVSFSGGQCRRLSLAAIFSCSAPIVVLDEPFVGIDKETQEVLWTNIKEELKDKTVIIIDHNFDDEQFFQKVFEINSFGGADRKR